MGLAFRFTICAFHYCRVIVSWFSKAVFYVTYCTRFKFCWRGVAAYRCLRLRLRPLVRQMSQNCGWLSKDFLPAKYFHTNKSIPGDDNIPLYVCFCVCFAYDWLIVLVLCAVKQ